MAGLAKYNEDDLFPRRVSPIPANRVGLAMGRPLAAPPQVTQDAVPKPKIIPDPNAPTPGPQPGQSGFGYNAAPTKEMPRVVVTPNMTDAEIRAAANRVMDERGTGQVAVDGIDTERMNKILGEGLREIVSGNNVTTTSSVGFPQTQGIGEQLSGAATKQFFLDKFGRYTEPQTIEDYETIARTEAALRRGLSDPELDRAQAAKYSAEAGVVQPKAESLIGLQRAKTGLTEAQTTAAGFVPLTTETIDPKTYATVKTQRLAPLTSGRTETPARAALRSAIAALPAERQSALRRYIDRNPDVSEESVLERIKSGDY